MWIQELQLSPSDRDSLFNSTAWLTDSNYWCSSKSTQEGMPSIRPSISQLWPDDDVWCPARRVHPGYEHGTGALGYNFHHWDIPPNCMYLRQPLSQCWDSTEGPDCSCNVNRTAESHPWIYGCSNAVRLVWLWAICNCLCYCPSLGRETRTIQVWAVEDAYTSPAVPRKRRDGNVNVPS